ncbi:TPA: hypothetical protein IFA10_003815 [Escherichia coli]|nr:hypothetical protein [Escherichia coli]
MADHHPREQKQRDGEFSHNAELQFSRVTLLDGAARHNVQVLITDSGQRTGTGSALMAMKDAGVNTYRWQGGEQRPATIISEPDRNVRYARLAGECPGRAVQPGSVSGWRSWS